MTQPTDPGRLAEAVRAGQALRGVRIIDCHTHLGTLSQLHVDQPQAAQLVSLMDRMGVEAACPSANMAISGDYRWGNDEVAAAMAAHPGRFRGYVVVNPNYPEDILPEALSCLDSAPFIGLKLHPEWHDYPPDGPAYEAALSLANERGLVVLSHNWGSAQHALQIAKRYPHLSVIQAHTGGAWRGRAPTDWTAAARAQANLYLDIAISVCWYGSLERLVSEVGSDKVLFGSDSPFVDAAPALGRVAYARLPDADKERILGLNMLEIMARRREPR